MSKKIFICSPYRGDVAKNVENTIKACRVALKFGFAPVAPHLYYPQMLNDQIPIERTRGIVLGLEAMLECEQVWVFGKPTEGMEAEIAYAQKNKIPIYYKEVGKSEV